MTDLNLPALREAVAKGMKLLEALAEPHEQPDGEDHAWRTCRRCLALEEGETEHARQLFRALLDEVEALRRENTRLVDIALPHARKQGAADGFQRGWHAALARVSQGDDATELSALVPGLRASKEHP